MPEAYRNAPVRSVIFQVRFPGETAIEVARPRLQQLVRDQLPKLYVPKAVLDTSPALQPYVFRSTDESEGMEVALNSVSYTTTQYEGYAAFRARALRFLGLFLGAVPEIADLNRVGLRYVNHIPVLRDSKQAAIPIADYLNVKLELPQSIPASVTELSTVFAVDMEAGKLRVVVRHEADERTGDERLVLDFDFAQGPGLPVTGIAEYLDRAHAHTKRIFVDLISDRYLPIMRGDEQ